MTLPQLLAHDIFDLPANWQQPAAWHKPGIDSYYTFVVAQVARYRELLKSLEPIRINGSEGLVIREPFRSNVELLQEGVERLGNGIVFALQQYINYASPSLAYQTFKNGLEPPGVHPMDSAGIMLSVMVLSPEDVFYRLRSSEKKTITEAAAMLHLPHQLRHLAQAYRFSIAGIPCMYAASSARLALREVRRDQWENDLYISKLRMQQAPIREVVLLDLRNRIAELRKRHITRKSPPDGDLLRFLWLWPLIMATSVRAAHGAERDDDGSVRTVGFNEEYVLPQLVLEWVINSRNKSGRHKLSGIAFSSSRVAAGDPEFAQEYNIAIPVDHAERRGLCPVRTQQFEISTPLAVNLLLTEEKVSTLPAELGAQQLETHLEPMEYHQLHAHDS
jgi:hypothetical protein